MIVNILDTHTLLWFLSGDKNLSKQARQKIEHKETLNFISLASLWKIAIKISLGKLIITFPFSDFKTILEDNGFAILPIEFEDIQFIIEMDFHHRDPFDRLIIAQAIHHQADVISKDESFKHYDINVYW
ncbi:MAG: type II toxin-antitoxin system VapC family toxin [Chitinophagales bacterium]|nr:type II toxin-antitoxin system VapC family toxin [Chitinophagales bacterium]